MHTVTCALEQQLKPKRLRRRRSGEAAQMGSKNDMTRKDFLTLTFTLIGTTAVGAAACSSDQNAADGGTAGTTGRGGRGGTSGTGGGGGSTAAGGRGGTTGAAGSSAGGTTGAGGTGGTTG